jgi:hypothetical protein
MSWHFLWLELCYQVGHVKGLAEWLFFIEGCRAWYVDSRNEREAAANENKEDAKRLEAESSDAEFERRHGHAGWFDNDKPELPLTRFQRFLLWLGFELD